MQINVTFKHFDGFHDVKEYLEKRLNKLEKFLNILTDAQAVVSLAKHKYTCDIRVLAKKTSFCTEVTHNDLRLAIDMAINKLEVQVKKYKEELKE